MRVLNYLELESHLHRSGIGTSVAQQRKALADTPIEVLTSPWKGGSLLGAVEHAARGDGLFGEYDVAHCNAPGPGAVTVARHAHASDIPLVLHAHVTREDFADSFRGSTRVGPLLERYLRWFYSQADLVLCPSEYTRGVLRDYPVTAPIRPVTNGVDLDAMTGHEALREPYRERYGLEGAVFFAVGNVFERKGLSTFCELARATDHEFVWFGHYDKGPHASEPVRRWTSDPPENVTFTGWVDDKRGAFAAGDVLCFPAKVENQGLVVLEAMACGKACVLSDIPVFREHYTDGEDCLICSTPAEFRDAVERLAADPSLRERLGENGRETAREHSLDRVGERLRAAYDDALSGRV